MARTSEPVDPTRTEQVGVRLSPAEMAEIRELAREDERTLAGWIRLAAMAEVKARRARATAAREGRQDAAA